MVIAEESAFNEARDKLTQDNLALSNDERQNASLNLASDQRLVIEVIVRKHINSGVGRFLAMMVMMMWWWWWW